MNESESTIVNVPLDAGARLELAAMVYARWSKAYEDQKKVLLLTWETAGKFCPKNEWPNYHQSMKIAALAELQLATQLKDAVCKFSPLVTGELG